MHMWQEVAVMMEGWYRGRRSETAVGRHVGRKSVLLGVSIG